MTHWISAEWREQKKKKNRYRYIVIWVDNIKIESVLWIDSTNSLLDLFHITIIIYPTHTHFPLGTFLLLFFFVCKFEKKKIHFPLYWIETIALNKIQNNRCHNIFVSYLFCMCNCQWIRGGVNSLANWKHV